MKFFFLFLLIVFTQTLNAQREERIIQTEIAKIKIIPSYSHRNMFGNFVPQIDFDSAFTKIVRLGTKAIPILIKKLRDTTLVSIKNPCFSEEEMKVHDVAWFLINEIEPFPRHTALKLVFCTSDECDHFPQGFFTFIHSNPSEYASRYKKYFYSKERLKYLKSKQVRY